MKNPIIKIFETLSDTELVECINDINTEDGTIALNSRFRQVVEEVRSLTNSASYSTDLMMVQMSIFREGALRFKKQIEL